MKKLYALVAVVAFSGLIASGACTKKTEEADKPTGKTSASKVTVKEEGSGVQIETDEGTVNVTGDDRSGKVNIKTSDGKKIKLSY